MKEQPKLTLHPRDGNVWVNPTTEPLRPIECLCLNCIKMKPGQPDHCKFAQVFYNACVEGKIALMVTRCQTWSDKRSAWEQLSGVEKIKLEKMEETIP